MERKSFVFYLDWCRLLLDDMPDVMRHKVLDAVLRYSLTGEEPDEVDVRFSAFSLMRMQLDRDAERYAERCAKNKENANERWQRERTDATASDNKQTDATASEHNQMDTTHADNVNETETEHENDNNIVILDENQENLRKRKGAFRKDVCRFFPKYPSELLEAFIKYWSEPTPDRTKMRFELQKTWHTGKRLIYWANHEKIPKNARSASNKQGPF